MKLAAYQLLAMLLLAACARRPAAYQPLSSLPASEPGNAPQLLFLSCRLTATSAAGPRLELLRAESVDGTLKNLDADADTPDFVRVTQLGSQGQALAAQRVPHPLRRQVEHVADDQRTFQRSEVVLPTAEFFVRLALRPAATRIRLEEMAAGRLTLLTEFPVPSKS